MARPLFYLLLLALSATTLSAQDTFYGTVEYKYEMKGEGAEMMAAFMPEKMIVKYGEKSMMTFMEGGMMGSMMGKIIVNGESGENFVVKDDEQSVYMISKEDMKKNAENQEKPRIEKLEEQKDILGYPCNRYKVTTLQEGEETVQHIWMTDKLKAPVFEGIDPGQMGGGFISGSDIPGFPMEVEVAISNTEMTLLLTATNIDNTKVEASIFERPQDYEVKDFSEMMQTGNK
ncbi:MAG: DUF4412 domain-containing protein [Lewinellaceae bacterium]|nr:DUF4412 domain-containing protein [Lewinellaceae bacterium]